MMISYNSIFGAKKSILLVPLCGIESYVCCQMEPDSFFTIAPNAFESLFKDKGSRFIGKAFSIKNENEAKQHVEQLWKEHHGARHVCYAWTLGFPQLRERANDDGEPSYSAGKPILGQIQAKQLTNVLVAVVRYYGGINLGVGGLMNAYKTAAQEVLDQCEIVTQHITEEGTILFDYEQTGIVMRTLSAANAAILHQQFDAECRLTFEVRKLRMQEIIQALDQLKGISFITTETTSL